MKKLLFLTASVLLTSQMAMAKSIDGRTFVQCFEKAFNERIAEVKEKSSKIAMCDIMTDEMRAKLLKAYTYLDGGTSSLLYYNKTANGAESVRSHYDVIKYEFECYESSWNMPWLDNTNLSLVEETFTKMLGQEMWTNNGSVIFSDLDFNYCYKGE